MVFGGSFDPPHAGHLSIVRYVLEAGLAECLDLIPANISPFKTDHPPADGAQRLRMLRAMIQDLHVESRGAYAAKLRILTLELERPPPSYTVDTLGELRRDFPGEDIGLLIGSDSLHDFDQWERAVQILEGHRVFVFLRPGDSRDELLDSLRRVAGALGFAGDAIFERVLFLDNPLVDCSSTAVRASLRSTERRTDANLLRCVSPSVRALILAEGLYE